jgi:hypothetical protein
MTHSSRYGHSHLDEGPDRALMTILWCALPVFVIRYFFNVNLETVLLIPSGAAILVYVIGSALGVKLFSADENTQQGKSNRK